MQKLSFDEELIEFAKLLQKEGYNLYAVGGAVRDKILGLEKLLPDNDVCSNAPMSLIIKIAKEKNYNVNVLNAKLQVVEVKMTNSSFQFARFRFEYYDDKDGHSPSDVYFIDDYLIDAKRRDFTINSLYYDLVSDKLYDPFDGLTDLKKKLVRAVTKSTLDSDPIRIFRMISLALRLDFNVELETLESAKKNINSISKLPSSKIEEEKEKLLNQGCVYKNFHNENFDAEAKMYKEYLGIF